MSTVQELVALGEKMGLEKDEGKNPESSRHPRLLGK